MAAAPRRAACTFLLANLFLPGGAMAFTPALPAGAEITAEDVAAAGSTPIPAGAWGAAAPPAEAPEGEVRRTAWRIPGNRAATQEIFAPLRAQIEAAGYEILFDCETDACGGFDFRYALDLLPEPEMHVDLGDFRYLAAQRGAGDHLALLVSRAPRTGFVHLTQVSAVPAADPVAGAATGLGAEPRIAPSGQGSHPVGALETIFAREGRVVLEGLRFATGAATLEPGADEALAALAAFLVAHPQARVILVGHTDAEGGLAANVALGGRRAEAVLRRLVEAHGVAASRLDAQGAGWLAPRASNRTPEGRALNRRVEAVLGGVP